MIKFFRKIRQNFLMENKTGKYFKYAIGEIILVVIGILIALSINNWNSDRIDYIKEQNLLKELKSDYLSNVKEIEVTLNQMITQKEAYERIFDYLDNDKPVDSDLQRSFMLVQGIGVFNSSNTTYKFIETNGINLLSNSEIRKDATILYDEYFSNIVIRRNNHYDLIKNSLMPFIKKEFMSSSVYDKEDKITRLILNVPINFKGLRKNIEFRNTLIEIYNYTLIRKHALEKTLYLLNEKIMTLEENILE
jgi:translation initiation factor 2 beta subunit (eIF-2beta)/eIF-5